MEKQTPVKTASARMLSLVALFDLQTGFFASVIDGISDDDAHNRLNTKANHIVWLTGSLVQDRYEVANFLEIDRRQTADELFTGHKGILEGVRYPSLAAFKKDWEAITPALREAMINATDEQLDQVLDMGGFKMSFYEYITFVIYREANCIGQIALWRRLLGYEAMKYM